MRREEEEMRREERKREETVDMRTRGIERGGEDKK